MMKKVLKYLLIILIIFSFSIMIVSCSQANGNGDITKQEETEDIDSNQEENPSIKKDGGLTNGGIYIGH